MVLCIIILFIGLVTTIWRIFIFQTYVDVYNDHLEGKGLTGLNIVNFYVRNEDIHNITNEKKSIFIHSTSGEFKIKTDRKSADKLYKYFVSKKM